MTTPKKKHKRCECLEKNVSQGCYKCSKYKMVFCLKDPNSPHKLTNGSGKKVNPVRYSFVKEEKLGFTQLKDNMIRRAKENLPNLFYSCRKIIFYDVKSDIEVDVVEIS